MSERRKEVPSKTRVLVMDEFNWRCAFCGHHSPHIHHMNENHNDNRPENLIPLCPNCHLVDQHNPTRTIELGRLQLFRRYKDPFILAHQFQPIYLRMSFFDVLEKLPDSTCGDERVAAIAAEGAVANSLIRMVRSLNMGEYYADELYPLVAFLPQRDRNLMLCPERPQVISASVSISTPLTPNVKNTDVFRNHAVAGRQRTEEMIVEMLRFQNWSPDYRFRKGGTPYG